MGWLPSQPARAALCLPFLLLPLVHSPAPAADAQALERFRVRYGTLWSLSSDAATGRPRRLTGGAIPLRPTAPGDEGLVEAAAAFLRQNTDLLRIDPASLRLRDPAVLAARGNLKILRWEIAPHGIPVLGAGVVLVLRGERLLHVDLVGTGEVRASPVPEISAERAARLATAAVDLRDPGLVPIGDPLLAFERTDAGHRLVWLAWYRHPHRPLRLRALIDAVTGDATVTDETVSACDPPAAQGLERRVLAGVRPERADEPERRELLPSVPVEGTVSGPDGFFVHPQPPYSGLLDGPAVRITCTQCENPIDPIAPLDEHGDIDFSVGGGDERGNGFATPADRATFFHIQGAVRLASRWLALPWLDDGLPAVTNIPSPCNAYWDGSAVHFYRSSPECSNTGEIRDVVVHEWGHGLDDNDGLEPPPLSVDGATGEAVADLTALLRSRDACVGDSFFLSSGRWPSSVCSGVRDLDPTAPGHDLGVLSVANAAGLCPPSGFYRGPLGLEGHCEGQILGQAFWHLVRNLATGTSFADGSDLPGEPLGVEQAWQTAERLFFLSRPLMASYAPSSMQSIGLSAYDAILLVDDEGDGVANGTPHAGAIHEAFAHHGIAETSDPPPTAPPCAAPADPAVTLVSKPDPASGLPALELSWSDTGAESYQVLRADDEEDAYLLLAGVPSGEPRVFLDRGVLPSRTYAYRVVAVTGGCLSAGATPVSGSPGALLRVEGQTITDDVGNGDGFLAEGEEADLVLLLGNAGSGPASDLQAVISSPDPNLVIVDPGPKVYGDIPPGATRAGPAFRVRAEPGVQRFVPIAVTAETAEGCLRAEAILEIHGPDLVMEAHVVVDDATGDGDGVWDAGEAIALAVDLRNEGSLRAEDVEGTLSFRGGPPPGIRITGPDALWDPVEPAATVRSQEPHFLLEADPISGVVRVPLVLEVRISGTLHRRFDLHLPVGDFPAGCEPRPGRWCDELRAECYPGNRTDCEERVSEQWSFDEKDYCRDCPYSFYVRVECGREMHLPLWDMEGARIQVTDLVSGNSPYLRCTNGAGFDVEGPDGYVEWGFDTNCIPPSDTPGNNRVMDCRISDPEGLCGLYRVDIDSGGYYWDLFSNCTGEDDPVYPIYWDCTEAWEDYNPLPEIAVKDLDLQVECPELVVSFDVQNIGCTEMPQDAPIRIRTSCGEQDDFFVPGPFPANSTTRVTRRISPSCPQPTVTVEADPEDLIIECTEWTTAAACDAEEGVRTLEEIAADFRVPVVDFSAPDPPLCVEIPVCFQNGTTDPGDVLWDFGTPGGDTSTELEPCFSYSDAGPYTVQLEADNGCGADTGFLEVQVEPAPSVDFEAPDPICAGEPACFEAEVGGVDEVLWQAGDGAGTMSQELDPCFTYQEAGDVWVELAASGPCGDGLRSRQLAVEAQPLADFSWPAPACEGEILCFDNASVGDLFDWDFGDGGGSSSRSPCHRFGAAASYGVRLGVENACGPDESFATVVVEPRPRAAFEDPGVLCAGAPHCFADQSEHADDWLWSFGTVAGDTSTEQNPCFTYDDAGRYMVRLDAGGECGVDSELRSVLVAPVPDARFQVAGSHCAGDLVCFENRTTGADSWQWDFGDGDGSIEFGPCHRYQAPGSYEVQLAAGGACGEDLAVEQLPVQDAPVADFEFSSQGGKFCQGQAVDFDDRSSGNPTSWSWDFGDGAVSTEQNPSHIYDKDGIYLVRLEVCKECGCSDPVFRAVQIHATCNTNCEANSNQIECAAGPAVIEGDTCLDHDNFNTTSYLCAQGIDYSGENKIWDLNFLEGSNFLVRLEETGSDPDAYDLDLLFSDSCNPPNCVSHGDEAAFYGDRTARNDDYWLIVDGRDGACGPYRLLVDCLSPDDQGGGSGGCRAPEFPGVTAAADPQPCAYGGLEVSWPPVGDWGTDPAGAACDEGSFEIWRAPSADPTAWSVVGTAAGTETVFLDAAVVPDVEYLYRVHAVNHCCGEAALPQQTASGIEPMPDPLQVSAGPDRLLACGSPTRLLGFASGGSGAGFDFLWDPPEGLDDPSSPNPLAETAGSWVLTVTDRGSGCSDGDEVEVGWAPVAPPYEPSALDVRASDPPLRVAKQISGPQLEAVWQDGLGAEGYRLYAGSLDSLRSGAYDHRPVACDLSEGRYVLEPQAGSRYYLATSYACDGSESSHGRRSDGTERPAPGGGC